MFLGLAQAAVEHDSSVEQALIKALAQRYANPQPEDRKPLDQAYAKAMRQVWQSLPQDADVGALFAEVVPGGQYRQVIGLMGQISHPDNATVLDVLGTYHPDGRVAGEARKAIRAMVSNMARNQGRAAGRPGMTGRAR